MARLVSGAYSHQSRCPGKGSGVSRGQLDELGQQVDRTRTVHPESKTAPPVLADDVIGVFAQWFFHGVKDPRGANYAPFTTGEVGGEHHCGAQVGRMGNVSRPEAEARDKRIYTSTAKQRRANAVISAVKRRGGVVF